MKTLASAIILSALLTILAEKASAQTSLSPMPVITTSDENGVDTINWFNAYEIGIISFGPADQSPISIKFYWSTGRDTFSSNLRIQDPSGITSGLISASIGTKSWTFIGGAATTDPGTFFDGSVRVRDGSVIEFDYSHYNPEATGPQHLCASKITKPNGEIFTFYNEHSTPWCRTRSIESNRGYQIRYDYSPTGFDDYRTKVTIINLAYEHCSPTATSCSSSMGWPALNIPLWSPSMQFSNSGGLTWTVTATSLKSPGQTVPSINWITEAYYPVNTYLGDIQRRVTSVTRDGQTWTYSYPSSDPILGGGTGQLMHVTDPLGNVTRYRRIQASSGGNPSEGEFADPNRLSKIADSLGDVTTYSYNQYNLLTEVALPEGNKHTASYDAVGNILSHTLKAKPGSGIADATTTYTYNIIYGSNECCDRPVSVTDAKGNVTEYTYDPVHKGVLTETGPAPTAGAPRPVKRFAYTQRYAWVKNSSGNYVQAASPIWVLDSEKTCRTSATVGLRSSQGCGRG